MILNSNCGRSKGGGEAVVSQDINPFDEDNEDNVERNWKSN